MRAETISWVGGEHEFALDLPRLEALQQRCDGDGIGLIYQRLVSGTFKVADVIATLALGLEGGGMPRQDATRLVRALYEDHGMNALTLPAQAVLGFSLNGWPEDVDTSGEAEGEAPQNP